MQGSAGNWPRDALPLGTDLNGYVIDGMLGRGGFGITYRALDRLDQIFAIKECFPKQFAVRQGPEVLPTDASDADALADCMTRFLREAKALMHLSKLGAAGDGVVKVATFFERNGTAYIVMEFLAGESLESYLKANPGGIPEDRLKELFDRLLHAVGCVHDAGLLHRDIKPANIFLRADGRPVLIDFGATRGSAGSTQAVTFTQIYSESYAPLEQIAGTEQGPFSDIYALGVTFYRAIGGTAIDAFTRHQAQLRGRPDPLKPAIELGAGRYDPRLLAAIDAALKVSSEERPKSVAALQAILNEAPEEGGTRIVTAKAEPPPLWEEPAKAVAPPPKPVAAPPKPAARSRLPTVAVAVLVPLILLTGIGLWYLSGPKVEPAVQHASATPAPTPTPQPKPQATQQPSAAEQQAAAQQAAQQAADAQAQQKAADDAAASKAAAAQAEAAQQAAAGMESAVQAEADKEAAAKKAPRQAAPVVDKPAAKPTVIQQAELHAAEEMVSPHMDRTAAEIEHVVRPEVARDYDTALALFQAGKFGAAEAAFRKFQEKFPLTPLAGHAQYFVGQSFVMRKDYAAAAAAFQDGLSRYSEGNQRGETLVKLGLIQGELGHTADACAAFSRLDHNFRDLQPSVAQMLATGKQRYCSG